jgi:hypothetical protein
MIISAGSSGKWIIWIKWKWINGSAGSSRKWIIEGSVVEHLRNGSSGSAGWRCKWIRSAGSREHPVKWTIRA